MKIEIRVETELPFKLCAKCTKRTLVARNLCKDENGEEADLIAEGNCKFEEVCRNTLEMYKKTQKKRKETKK